MKPCQTKSCSIHQIEYEYNEGGAINTAKLMTNTKTQYMEMIRSKEWHTPPKENQEILELTTEIKELKDQYLKGEKANSSKRRKVNS